MQETILILDTGSPVAVLAARTLRLQNLYAKLVPASISLQEVRSMAPKGIVWATPLKGDVERVTPDMELLSCDVATLVLGDAAVWVTMQLSGSIQGHLPQGESVTLDLSDSPLFEGISGGERKLRHLSSLILPPDLLEPLATATQQPIGFAHRNKLLFALEYPLEHNDPDGARMLFNFATKICGAQPIWDEEAIIREAKEQISLIAGDGKLLCAISGGVDSAVSAKLVQHAIADRLQCIFVDTGLMREGEAREVMTAFRESMGMEVQYIDAKDMFLAAMSHVSSSKDKERIATSLLSQVLRKQLGTDDRFRALVTGTNLNDILYGVNEVNVEEPAREDTSFLMVEPLRGLFKEEVRRLGGALALPAGIVDRQTFPASGLALRLLGEVTQQKLHLLRMADSMFQEEIRAGGHEKRLWQYYATLLDMPDGSGNYAVVLRALQAAQGNAYAARLPYDLLERVTARIRSDVPQVVRVTYDLTPNTHYDEQE